MVQNMLHLGQWSMSTWEECVLCSHWVDGLRNVSQVNLIVLSKSTVSLSFYVYFLYQLLTEGY